MKKHHKINWKKGLEITPEIFIASDNYHIAERNLLGRFLAAQRYGIFPDSNFHIENDIENQNIYIRNLKCNAITKDGFIVDIQQDTNFPKKIALTNSDNAEFYLILTINPFSVTLTDEKEVVYPEYNITLNRTDKPIEQGIPISKIYKNNSHWELDKNYVPPVISLNAVDTLKQKYIDIQNVISEITGKLPEEHAFYLQIMMLQIELNNYSLNETPQEFILLLKKFCRIFQLYIKKTKKLNEMPVVTHFMEKPYNHSEIEKQLQAGFETLTAINQEIDEEPEVEEEDPIEEIEIKI